MIGLRFLSLCLFYSAYWAHPAYSGIVEDFDEVRALMRNSLDQTVICDPFLENTPTSSCSFQDLCKVFSANLEAPYLYRNPKGDQIPNGKIYNYERK